MAGAPFEGSEDVRVALREIVSEYGPDVLSRPAIMSSLLADLLPQSPKVAGILVAAAGGRVAEQLRQHVSHGMGLAVASRLVTASFADSTLYLPDACAWVVAEFAVALGLTADADQASVPTASPPDETACSAGTSPVAPGGPLAGDAAAGVSPAPLDQPDSGDASRSMEDAVPGHPPTLVVGLEKTATAKAPARGRRSQGAGAASAGRSAERGGGEPDDALIEAAWSFQPEEALSGRHAVGIDLGTTNSVVAVLEGGE